MSSEFEVIVQRAAAEAWGAMGGEPEWLSRLFVQSAVRTLPSAYEVSAFAAACVGVATLAVAERLGSPRLQAIVDARHASLAFVCERALTPVGWSLPEPWDPIAGDYATADGFIRLHTNYAHHRDAVLRVLNVPNVRDEVARSVARWSASALEAAIVAAGGCAAALRSEVEWRAHAAGRAVADEPLVAFELQSEGSASGRHQRQTENVFRRKGGSGGGEAQSRQPLAGLRVLDLTRVIAGPVATRFLAAYGAEVLRIDPPGFQEVGALLPETTVGKRCAALDLRVPEGRAHFESLVAEADVLVCGLRSDALAGLGLTRESLSACNPQLIFARLDAYGFSADGPWRARRGFDSLVQMSTGIAERGMRAAGADRPRPLPAQALDHGTGYLLAAAIVRASTQRDRTGRACELRLSLARTAALLASLGEADLREGLPLTAAEREPFLEDASTAWGPIRRVRCPGNIDEQRPRWSRTAGPLGTSSAQWLPRIDR